MQECTEETSQETLQAIVTSVQAQAHGDNNWLSSFSHDLTLVDADIKHSKKQVASQFKSIDMNAAQLSDPVIGKVMKYLKSGRKPSREEMFQESPVTRQCLHEW